MRSRPRRSTPAGGGCGGSRRTGAIHQRRCRTRLTTQRRGVRGDCNSPRSRSVASSSAAAPAATSAAELAARRCSRSRASASQTPTSRPSRAMAARRSTSCHRCSSPLESVAVMELRARAPRRDARRSPRPTRGRSRRSCALRVVGRTASHRCCSRPAPQASDVRSRGSCASRSGATPFAAQASVNQERRGTNIGVSHAACHALGRRNTSRCVYATRVAMGAARVMLPGHGPEGRRSRVRARLLPDEE